MATRKRALPKRVPKRVTVLKKRPKKKPAADGIVFTYAHGKETVSAARRKSAK
jgi:hypothetical protein